MATHVNLLNGLSFTDAELTRFQSVTDLVDQRFNRWLVSQSIVNPINDSFLSHLSAAEYEVERRIRNENNTNRELLDVEIEGQKRRLAKLEEQKDLQERAKKLLNGRLAKTLRETLSDTDKLARTGLSLRGRDADDITHVLRTLYSPSVTFNRIWNAIAVIPKLPEQLAKLVNTAEFCKSIGRDMPQRKVQGREAIGFLGIEGCKVVIPLIIAKNRLRGSSRNFPLSGAKLWSYCVTMGNTATHLLKESGHRDPAEGFMLAVTMLLAHIAVYNVYDHCYDMAREELMGLLRNRNAMDLYFVVPHVNASPTILADTLTEFAPATALELLELFDWENLKRIKKGVTEELTRVPTHKRSMHGQALKQAKHYAKFIMLRESKTFVKDHLRPFLACAFLSDEQIRNLIRANLKHLDLKGFIEA
ncbi:MAG: hypothetical protein GY833_12070 [Aestuariibacter sp.]|nr:hypothetical protein [Aestuariibacter sp.]